MTSENTGITIEDAPATFKSFVWQHFGYPAEMINGKRVTDKTRTTCKHCMKTMPYTAANTSTMQRHLQHHHSTVLKSTTAPVKKTRQTTLTNTFGPQLPQSGVRATAITRDIGVFIAADMRPFSVVENQGFRRLLHTLEPKYTVPSRTHFTRTVIANLYEESKSKIVQILKDAASIAITTDGWTSRVGGACESARCDVIKSRAECGYKRAGVWIRASFRKERRTEQSRCFFPERAQTLKIIQSAARGPPDAYGPALLVQV
ncbi:hypothetical protein SRHO_G00130230 [Serrasalmus rhombeus]